MLISYIEVDDQINIKFSNAGLFNYMRSVFEQDGSKYEVDIDSSSVKVNFHDFVNPAETGNFVKIYLKLKSEDDSLEIKYHESVAGFVMIRKNIEKKISELEILQKEFDKTINGRKTTPLNKTMFKSGFQPYDFQERHAEKIVSSSRYSDFSSPGAGKTIISYMVVASMLADQIIDTIVVLGPKSASHAWFNEWSVVLDGKYISQGRHFDFSNKNRKDLDSITDRTFSNDKLNIVFINYHKLDSPDFQSKLVSILSKRKFMLIMDEAHYIKNINGSRHMGSERLSSFAKASLILSGTPIPRAMSEAYYIINSLWPSISHGDLSQETFAKNLLLDTNNQKLIDQFKNTFVRMNKNSLVSSGQLKPLHEEIIKIDRNEVEEFLVEQVPNNQVEQKALDKWNRALLIRLMQAAAYPPLLRLSLEESLEELRKDLSESDEFDESDAQEFESVFKTKKGSSSLEKQIEDLVKDSEIIKMIEEYENGTKISQKWLEAEKIIASNSEERIIVWDIFKKSMNAFSSYIQKAFPNRKVLMINGSITGSDRDFVINKFRSTVGAILIASPATIAESLSLHKECHKAIYLNKNFTGSQWMQSKDRIHRLVKPGEPSYVKNIYYINAEQSIDELIHLNLKIKEDKQSKIID